MYFQLFPPVLYSLHYGYVHYKSCNYTQQKILLRSCQIMQDVCVCLVGRCVPMKSVYFLINKLIGLSNAMAIAAFVTSSTHSFSLDHLLTHSSPLSLSLSHSLTHTHTHTHTHVVYISTL